VTQPAELADEVEAETGFSRVNYISQRETLPTALALIVHKHHFRSPPVLP